MGTRCTWSRRHILRPASARPSEWWLLPWRWHSSSSLPLETVARRRTTTRCACSPLQLSRRRTRRASPAPSGTGTGCGGCHPATCVRCWLDSVSPTAPRPSRPCTVARCTPPQYAIAMRSCVSAWPPATPPSTRWTRQLARSPASTSAASRSYCSTTRGVCATPSPRSRSSRSCACDATPGWRRQWRARCGASLCPRRATSSWCGVCWRTARRASPPRSRGRW